MRSFQYNKKQMGYFKKASDFWYERCSASSAKTLEFRTAATRLSFDYKIVWMGSPDSIELEIDGLVSRIVYVKDIEKEGKLTFDLPAGEKNAVIYLPADATVYVRDFEINDAFVPAQKSEKVLWMGDSITQGFGPLRSAETYVSVANRLLRYDILNQGIGGYVYDKNALVEMDGYRANKIIIAMGTNQYGTESMKEIEEYYERLKDLYGDTKVLSVTPIWRGDSPDGLPTLASFCRKTKAICEKYENITVVEGFRLIPHLPEYFLDNLHPNQLGCEVYGRNLVLAIREAGF